jgi:hypothetical protein
MATTVPPSGDPYAPQGWSVADALIDNAIAENGGGASQQKLARQA